jgi:hypothetical protein
VIEGTLIRRSSVSFFKSKKIDAGQSGTFSTASTRSRHKREDVAAVHSALSHHRLRNVKGLAQDDPEDAPEPR